MEVKLLRDYIKLVIESAPSKLNIREPTLSADSTGYENSHLNREPLGTEDFEQDILNLAPHLIDPEEEEGKNVFGPVSPKGMDPLMIPDPFVRGQYDNVTWSR